MSTAEQNLEALRDIRNIMERSSRFISLSGWSGIFAGVCALGGAFIANSRINSYQAGQIYDGSCPDCLQKDLIYIAAAVFAAAFIGAIFFTAAVSRKQEVPMWGSTARKLMWNTLFPMLVGGLVIWKMMDLKHFELLPATSLIFYGLALVNGSKYTLGEVRYLGYAEILTGILALWLIKYGVWIWALGFGILHIIYGITMWVKYDRREERG